jgi:hypothetical protein
VKDVNLTNRFVKLKALTLSTLPKYILPVFTSENNRIGLFASTIQFTKKINFYETTCKEKPQRGTLSG